MREYWQRAEKRICREGDVAKKAGVRIDTWMHNVVDYNNKKREGTKIGRLRLLLCFAWTSASVCVTLGSWEQKNLFYFFSHCLVSLCHSFSPSLPSYLPQVFRYLPSGCCWWCWEVQGALLSSCQGLCGPRGAPAEGPGQFYCPDAFQSMRDMVGSEGGVLGKGGSRREEISLWFEGTRSCVRGVTAESTDCLPSSPPALSRPILSLEEPQGRQMHLPEIHTPGPDAYLPHLQGFTETLHVAHKPVSTYTLYNKTPQFFALCVSEIWI